MIGTLRPRTASAAVLAWLSITPALALANGPAPVPQSASVALRQIHIVSNGAWTDRISGDEGPEHCRAFRLTEPRVRRILTQSQPVTERAYAHDLDASRCHATGTARTSRGGRVHWRVDAEGRVLLTTSGGPVSYRQYLGPDLTGTRKTPATAPR